MNILFLLIIRACSCRNIIHDADVMTLSEIGLALTKDSTTTYLSEGIEVVNVKINFISPIEYGLVQEKCLNAAELTNRTIIATFSSAIFNRYPDVVTFEKKSYFNEKVNQKTCDGDPSEQYSNVEIEACFHLCETLDSCKAFSMDNEKNCKLFESCVTKVYSRSTALWVKQKGAGNISRLYFITVLSTYSITEHS